MCRLSDLKQRQRKAYCLWTLLSICMYTYIEVKVTQVGPTMTIDSCYGRTLALLLTS